MKMNLRLLLATRNAGKEAEMRALLAGLPVEILSLASYPGIPETVEDGNTLESNATKKAKEAFDRIGLPAIADDTGLEVYALGGRPGVHSARFAGEKVSYDANNRKLLDELRKFDAHDRKARFRCVVALVYDGGTALAEGVCEGSILKAPRGAGGFGYDPLFLPDAMQQSFAELTPEEKNTVSHRSRAMRLMRSVLIQKFRLPSFSEQSN